jgi:hypothetical protein
MTLQQFDNTRWGKGMYAQYRGERMLIVQVDFEEALIGMIPEKRLPYYERGLENTSWARCENVDLMNKEQGDKSSATQRRC